MPHTFDADVVAAVLRHMNGDHADDNLLIVRAFAPPTDAGSLGGEIAGAVMIGLDGDGGVWEYRRDGIASEVRVAWPGGPIWERPQVRREVVAVYDAARARLGLEPRPHD